MNNENELREEIHDMNGIIGRLGFSIDELFELNKKGEGLSKENLAEVQTAFDELIIIWKKIRSAI